MIYTAGFTDAVPAAASSTSQGFPYLTYPVFTFYNQPSNEAHYLAYDAALLLVIIVLVLLVVSRIIVARTQRHSESRGR